MKADRRITREDIRASLWFWPVVVGLTSLAVNLALLALPPLPDPVSHLLWPGDAASASTLLQVVASSVMAATTLTFSLTVIALQLSSQQFSPRLLREFARDRFTQSVLAVLVSAFVVSLTGLRGVSEQAPVPAHVVALATVLGIASVVALLAFVGHIARALRVDTMMVAVHGEAVATLLQMYPAYGDDALAPAAELPGPEHGTRLHAAKSGFVRTIDAEPLFEAARRHDLVVRLGLRPGDHVVEGAPIGAVWGRDGSAVPDPAVLDDALARGLRLGFERTVEQDAALGLRQLTDIAVKAISPGINDPVTAAHAIGYCADLLVRVQGRRLGPQQRVDTDGIPRLVLPDRDPRYYFDLVCGPVRRFGRAEPLVLNALLRMLRDCASNARDDGQRSEIARQAQLVLEQMSHDILPTDADEVRDLAARVRAALEGRLDDAYIDRAGETRSV